MVWEISTAEQCEFLKWMTVPGRVSGMQWLAEDGNLTLSWPKKPTEVKRAKSCAEILTMNDQAIAFKKIKALT